MQAHLRPNSNTRRAECVASGREREREREKDERKQENFLFSPSFTRHTHHTYTHIHTHTPSCPPLTTNRFHSLPLPPFLLQPRRREERADKQRLRDLSKQSVAGWGNTIAGQRQARLQAKAQREAELERKRQAIDREEAAYQEEERAKAINRAKVRARQGCGSPGWHAHADHAEHAHLDSYILHRNSSTGRRTACASSSRPCSRRK